MEAVTQWETIEKSKGHNSEKIAVTISKSNPTSMTIRLSKGLMEKMKNPQYLELQKDPEISGRYKVKVTNGTGRKISQQAINISIGVIGKINSQIAEIERYTEDFVIFKVK